MQFNWQFTRDITRLTDGEAVPAQLYAAIASLAKPCNGGIAGISDITLQHSAGASSPLTPDIQSQADRDRFVGATPAPGINWVRANDGPHVRQAAVSIIRGPAKPNGNLAYFSLSVSLRGGGQIWWTYLYQRVSGDGAGGGLAVTSEAGRRPPRRRLRQLRPARLGSGRLHGAMRRRRAWSASPTATCAAVQWENPPTAGFQSSTITPASSQHVLRLGNPRAGAAAGPERDVRARDQPSRLRLHGLRRDGRRQRLPQRLCKGRTLQGLHLGAARRAGTKRAVLPQVGGPAADAGQLLRRRRAAIGSQQGATGRASLPSRRGADSPVAAM